MLVTIIFSFSYNVFYSITDRNYHSCYIYFLVCKCIQFGQGQIFVFWEWVNHHEKGLHQFCLFSPNIQSINLYELFLIVPPFLTKNSFLKFISCLIGTRTLLYLSPQSLCIHKSICDCFDNLFRISGTDISDRENGSQDIQL